MTKHAALRTIELTKQFSKKKFKNFQDLAAHSIFEDILDRGGIKYALEECDSDAKRDMKKTWSFIIAECFKQLK